MNHSNAMLLSLFFSTIVMMNFAADNKKLATQVKEDIKLYSFAQLKNLRDQLIGDCFGFISGHTLTSGEDTSLAPDDQICLLKKEIVQLALVKNACLQQSNKQRPSNPLTAGNG
ncbi:MAG TPA: hypothetical protein VFF04_03425 [Candidatus Babeliales bacterium]|nr:hypothetical protein [Candidatus Babeliales bacterium]